MRTAPLRRAAVAAAGALALAAPLAVVAAAPAAAATPRVLEVFPTNALTVADSRQLTGLRVDLPDAPCSAAAVCGLQQRLEQLDGFDLDPRMSVRFDRPVDPAAAMRDVRVVRADGTGTPIGVDRVVYDAATTTGYAHPARQLDPGTTYRLQLRGRTVSTFTTMSATDGLQDLERLLDSAQGRQYLPAAQRGLRIDAVVPAQGTTLAYVQDRGTTGGLVRTDVPNASAAGAGSYAFGSYLAPSWLRADRTIEQRPTREAGPRPTGLVRLPFVAIVPAGTAPAGGWPVAAFGHGFTRSDADVFLAAATNASRGLATVATHVVGHGYGPRSTWEVRTADGAVQTLPAYGRGVDLEGDGVIGATEGVSPLPQSAAGAVSSRDGLRQTVVDVGVLLRSAALPSALPLRPTGQTYYGQSFGGIYGTMLTGVDDTVTRAVLNVPGGPVSEIARLSPSFRPLTAQALQIAGLLNGGTTGFTESMPLAGEPPVTSLAPGALAIQDYLADSTWLQRSGGPETYAPLVRDEEALFQVARGDQTVPNPTSATLLAAGDLFGRTSLYRNDLTPQAGTNPHGFLLSPAFPAGFLPGQAQVSTFLTTGAVIDPDGAGPVWEVPVRDPGLLRSLGF